jgi:hypothetical protein
MKFDSVGQVEVDKLKRKVILSMYNGSVMSALYREEYKSTLSEIATLEESNQEYSIQNRKRDFKVSESTYAAGLTYYGTESDKVRIVYNDDIGTLVHELKHAYQFEIGNMSFDESGKKGDLLYDFYDEREAYNRGAALGREARSDDFIKTNYHLPSTYTTINSQPAKNRSIIKLLNARKNIYRKDGVTYKAGVKVTK